MKLKNYQSIQIKRYLKNYSLLLIVNGITRNSKNQLLIKQELKKLKINCYKTYNKLAVKVLNNSTYKNLTKLIYSTTFFLTQKGKSFNISTIKCLETLLFSTLGIKLNKKVYAIKQIENIKSASYKNEMSILYQFLLINLKLIQITNKFSKQCDLNT